MEPDDAIVGMIILIVATCDNYCLGQMVIYPVGKALKDGRTDNVKFSYVDFENIVCRIR